MRADRPAEQVVTLVEEGPPIEGRIVDLEGRPVAGASVQAASIWYDEKGRHRRLDRQGPQRRRRQPLARLGEPVARLDPRSEPRERLITIAATTGADGRFKLTGIGRDRIADLIVSGPGIATTQVYAFSRRRAGDPHRRQGHDATPSRSSSTPRSSSSPWRRAKRVEGVVRDKDSGRPIAGLEIQAAVFDEHSLIPAPGIEATTDAEGRYRLDGLPKAPAYRLFIKPAKGLPYTNGTLKVPAESPGLEPVTFDFALKRGVFVRGRVIDKVTGRPVQGLRQLLRLRRQPERPRIRGVLGAATTAGRIRRGGPATRSSPCRAGG